MEQYVFVYRIEFDQTLNSTCNRMYVFMYIYNIYIASVILTLMSIA